MLPRTLTQLSLQVLSTRPAEGNDWVFLGDFEAHWVSTGCFYSPGQISPTLAPTSPARRPQGWSTPSGSAELPQSPRSGCDEQQAEPAGEPRCQPWWLWGQHLPATGGCGDSTCQPRLAMGTASAGRGGCGDSTCQPCLAMGTAPAGRGGCGDSTCQPWWLWGQHLQRPPRVPDTPPVAPDSPRCRPAPITPISDERINLLQPYKQAPQTPQQLTGHQEKSLGNLRILRSAERRGRGAFSDRHLRTDRALQRQHSPRRDRDRDRDHGLTMA